MPMNMKPCSIKRSPEAIEVTSGGGCLSLFGLPFLLAGLFGTALGIGIVESCMARLRLVRIPHLLIGAGTLAGLAFIISLR